MGSSARFIRLLGCFLFLLRPLSFPSVAVLDATLVDDDRDDDGCSQDRCDRIEWDDARFAWQDADKVAQQGHGTTRE